MTPEEEFKILTDGCPQTGHPPVSPELAALVREIMGVEEEAPRSITCTYDPDKDYWAEAHAAVKTNPMVYRQKVYDKFRQHLEREGYKRGILTQRWYANNADDQPAPLGGDFTLDSEEWSPISELRKIADSCESELYDFGEDDQYRTPIADRLPGWSDIEQAWMGDSNSSSNSCSRPYNWIRHWVLTLEGPPILVDPHFVMHLRNTPLPPVGELVPGSIEYYGHHKHRWSSP
jgi:hypothetical protein